MNKIRLCLGRKNVTKLKVLQAPLFFCVAEQESKMVEKTALYERKLAVFMHSLLFLMFYLIRKIIYNMYDINILFYFRIIFVFQFRIWAVWNTRKSDPRTAACRS